MDVKTIIFVFSLANLFVFLFLLYYAIISRKKNLLIRLYALGKLCMGTAWILMALRNSFPVIVSVTLGNTFLAWGSGLEVYSMMSVNAKKPVSFRRLFLAGLVILILISLFTNQPNNIKVFVFSFINGILFITGFWGILKQRHSSNLRYLVIVIYLYLGIVLIFRGFSAILIDTGMSLTSKGLIQNISFVSFLLPLLTSIVFFLLIKEKDDREIMNHAQALSDTNQLLKASNATKDKLFSIIAHDLRGPMAATAQLTDILFNRHKEFSDEKKEMFLEQLSKNSNNTYELLENLLNWSRSQLNSLSVDAKPFSINTLINDVLVQVESMNMAKKQIIENNVPGDWKVQADYEMIKVVVRNILTNAIKFSPAKSKIIINGKEETSAFEIKFIDQGLGMKPEVLDHILASDFLHSTPGTNNEKGSGIGLKLTKDFIEKNGGTISISSKLNEGSTVGISLSKARV